MNEYVKQKLTDFIRSLSDNEANELWDFFSDGHDATNELIDMVLKTHPNLDK